ncbi:MAG: DUF1656 domain-containing protein [Candidatus Eremiobacteraeota bacterium]|nr:DUF1656 domain-containing protein [Candidatus Eremiobacteraeota bacterium]
MKFVEVNLLGVYVAPIALLMLAAWLVTAGLRQLAARAGILRYVWHPALFLFNLYIIVLSSIVLIIAH